MTFSRVDNRPPTMIVKVPFRAPGSPPETGASSASTECFASSAAIERAAAGLIVELSTKISPGCAPATMPFWPSTTFSTSGVSGRFVKITSTCLAISAGVFPSIAPSATSSSTAGRERLLTTMGNPAFKIFRAIAFPIRPRPIYPTLSIKILLIQRRPIIGFPNAFPKICEIISPKMRLKLRLDYGTTGLDVDLPADRTTVIEPVFVPPVPDPVLSLRNALRSPIGKPPLRELLRPGQTVGISVCDITRAQPRQAMIEALLSEVPGIRMQDVTIFIATGTHRANTADEIERMLGKDIVAACRVVCHDARDGESLIYV